MPVKTALIYGSRYAGKQMPYEYLRRPTCRLQEDKSSTNTLTTLCAVRVIAHQLKGFRGARCGKASVTVRTLHGARAS